VKEGDRIGHLGMAPHKVRDGFANACDRQVPKALLALLAPDREHIACDLYFDFLLPRPGSSAPNEGTVLLGKIPSPGRSAKFHPPA
jgi:hypothetical protein